LIVQVSEREKVPRFRTTAIAALAVSALLATSGAAYAHDFGQKKSAREASEAPSMSWAYSKGDLSDLSHTDNVFDGAKATAFMMGINGKSTFRLNVTGIDESASRKTYPAHLHEGPCVADDGLKAGDHYNAQKELKLPTPWLVNSDTEVWLTFKVNSEGRARVTVSVPFVPTPGPDGAARSIVIHTDDTSVKTRLACLPLDIQKFSSSN
jgi:superoxide dismutase, Cu-Zn family